MPSVFSDGALEARPVSLIGTFPPIVDTFQLRTGLGVGYDGRQKKLTFEAHLGRHRLEVQGIDCTALETEAIAAGVLLPVAGCGYRQFKPRRLMSCAFRTGVPATVLNVVMTKVSIGRGERLEFPADAYLAIFPSIRPRPEDTLFRLRAVVGGWRGDVHLDIVLFASDLMLALTQVGYFRAVSRSSEGGCVVSLPHRLSLAPATSFALSAK